MRAKANAEPALEDKNHDDLPEGWAAATIDDAGHWLTGGTPSRRVNEYFNGSIPWVKSGDLNDGLVTNTAEKITKVALQNSAARLLPAGTLSIALYGATIGKLGLLDIQAATNQACANCIVDANLVDRWYLFYYLLHERQALIDAGQGGAQPNLTNQIVRNWPFILAPLHEQHRIVAKVEELLENVNASRERLAKVPKILKAFRQSVLAAACSGRLTEDWRDGHTEIEPSSKLLDRILQKRKHLSGRQPCEPDGTSSLDLPDEWAVKSMDALTSRITSGSRDWKKYYRDDGPGTFIMAQNIRPLFFDSSYRLAVAPPQDDRDRARSLVRRGDILVTIVGANTGDVCRIVFPIKEHYVCQSVALMRPVDLETAPWLELWLNSPSHGQAQYKTWIYGEGRPHLSFDNLKATAAALPPLEEQHEIVRRVEILFKLGHKIEKRVAAATKRADKLTQAILAKAFRGELVLTEAELARQEGRDYEPASVLLERIKAKRNRAASASKNGAGRQRRGPNAGKN